MSEFKEAYSPAQIEAHINEVILLVVGSKEFKRKKSRDRTNLIEFIQSAKKELNRST